MTQAGIPDTLTLEFLNVKSRIVFNKIVNELINIRRPSCRCCSNLINDNVPGLSNSAIHLLTLVFQLQEELIRFRYFLLTIFFMKTSSTGEAEIPREVRQDMPNVDHVLSDDNE